MEQQPALQDVEPALDYPSMTSPIAISALEPMVVVMCQRPWRQDCEGYCKDARERKNAVVDLLMPSNTKLLCAKRGRRREGGKGKKWLCIDCKIQK